MSKIRTIKNSIFGHFSLINGWSKFLDQEKKDSTADEFVTFCRISFLHNNSDGSRTVATSKMEHFLIIVNSWKPLTVITKSSILDVSAK